MLPAARSYAEYNLPSGAASLPYTLAEFFTIYERYFYASTVEQLARLYAAGNNATLASILIGADISVLCPNLDLLTMMTASGHTGYNFYFSMNKARPGCDILRTG